MATGTLVTISQLTDLSLNCQEGVVNFHALHTLLSVMISQLKLKDVAVEFRGEESDKIQALISAVKPNRSVNSYEVTRLGSSVAAVGQKSKKSSKKTSLQDVMKDHGHIEEKKEKEIRVIERRKNSKEDPDLNPPALRSPEGSLTPILVVESEAAMPPYTITVTKAAFEELHGDLETVKTKIKELEELPGNLGLIEATRTASSPILDMFQILNLTKRMDANEQAVEKMTSLVEDVIKTGFDPSKVMNVKEPAEGGGEAANVLNDLDERVTNLEKQIHNVGVAILDVKEQEVEGPAVSPPTISMKSDRESEVGTLADAGSVSSTPKDRRVSKAQLIKIWEPQQAFQSGLQGVDLNEMSLNEALALIQQEFTNFNTWIRQSIKQIDQKQASPGEMDSEIVNQKFKECTGKMEELNELYNTQIGLLNEQFNNVQQEVNDVVTKLEVILPGGDSTGINAETTMDLANKLVLLEKEIYTISELTTKLQDEKEERDKQTESILEQIDVLKIIKANREDLEDALGDKADACAINRKVSFDQFDAACDDLSRGIEEALHKLEDQEEMWNQALESIQREVGNKLDKMEVDPLREFVNSKLRALQEKFKSLTALKREQEAAGTKSKFLRNVNCISCDKDVVMRKEMDASLKPKAQGLPPNRNMAPYLAYELDQLRKQQKCVPHSRNLNFLETALKTRGAKDKNHICNRYCGGSHTVTTPQQRVTRLGHFLEQWGPEIAPLTTDEYVRGTDNHMYRARDDSAKKTTKQEGPGRASVGTGKENLVTRDEDAVPDRDAFITPEAREAIMAVRNSDAIIDHKVPNIGSTGLRPSPSEEHRTVPRDESSPMLDARTSQGPQHRGSQVTEPRLSQARRGSQSSAGAPRLSLQEPKMSQGRETRESVAGLIPRMSQAATAEVRPSKTASISAERRTSVTFGGKGESFTASVDRESQGRISMSTTERRSQIPPRKSETTAPTS